MHVDMPRHYICQMRKKTYGYLNFGMGEDLVQPKWNDFLATVFDVLQVLDLTVVMFSRINGEWFLVWRVEFLEGSLINERLRSW